MTRTTLVSTIAASALALFAGCGGGDDANNPDAPPHADAPPTPDAPPSCTSITVGVQDIAGQDPGPPARIVWSAPVTTDLGDGGEVLLAAQFYDEIRPDLAGTWDLTDAVDGNFMTCASCYLVFSLDASGAVARTFFQSGGSETLTESPFTANNLAGNVTNLTFEEVTIDDMTFESTPVPGGECLSVGASYALAADDVPNAWTCPTAAYNDGATCDCVCGLSDPDCGIGGAPVNGCTGTQVCFNDACADPPANDTCQTFTPVVIGTPITGTTIGATGNYDAGLEAATCTGFSQAGPDVAYRVTLTAAQAITVTLSGLDAGYDGSVSLLRRGAPAVCDAATVQCLAGADAGVEGDDETFTFTSVQAGNYWIIVDSFYSAGPQSAGNFTLTVTSP